MGSFGGLGAEPPTAGGLAGSRGRFVIAVNRRFKLLVT